VKFIVYPVKAPIKELVAILQKKSANRKAKNAAAEEIYAVLSKPLHHHCFKKMHHTALAVGVDDIVSIAFTKAFAKIHLYNGKSQFSTWLFNIANNTIRDELRRIEKSHFVTYAEIEHGLCNDFRGTTFEQGPYNYNGLRDLVRKERAQYARALVNKIDGKGQKKAVKLFYFEQLSYREIMAKMDVPMGLVKTYIHRGCLQIEKRVL